MNPRELVDSPVVAVRALGRRLVNLERDLKMGRIGLDDHAARVSDCLDLTQVERDALTLEDLRAWDAAAAAVAGELETA